MNIKEVLDIGRSSEIETLPPTYYFYAAYIFDQVETQKEDIRFLLEESQHLGKTVRYWWLSQAMDIQSSPDRLIVWVHLQSNDEIEGMDLYDALQKSQVLFAELNAAAAEEYMYPGRQVATIKSICKNGLSIFAIYFN